MTQIWAEVARVRWPVSSLHIWLGGCALTERAHCRRTRLGMEGRNVPLRCPGRNIKHATEAAVVAWPWFLTVQ